MISKEQAFNMLELLKDLPWIHHPDVDDIKALVIIGLKYKPVYDAAQANLKDFVDGREAYCKAAEAKRDK